MTLTETGTHASIDARVGGYNSGERDPAMAIAACPKNNTPPIPGQ
ncbi:hypothetical protein [Streptomyces sp. NBC_01092]|nr:hypothetical protein OG254_48975 [Streptomyces sp. NBC_01092]